MVKETQEKPDFELTGEQVELLHEGAHRYEQIMTLGNVAMHLRFLTDAVMELTDEIKGVRKNLQTSGEVAKHFGDYSIGNTAYLNLRKIEDVSADTERIADNIECACDPDSEARMKVHADGDIMNHPY